MPNILDEIVAAKREELVAQKRTAPLDVLQGRIVSQPGPLDLSAALTACGIQLIAEVKKASPSRGLLRADFDPVDLAGTYTGNGAPAGSVRHTPPFPGALGPQTCLHPVRPDPRLAHAPTAGFAGNGVPLPSRKARRP